MQQPAGRYRSNSSPASKQHARPIFSPPRTKEKEFALNKIALVVLLAAGIVSTSGRSAFAQTVQTLHVAVVPSDTAAQMYYAADLGMFTREGVNVQIDGMTSGPAIAAAVASGALDIGFSNFVSLATAHGKGLPFTMVAPANLSIAGAPTVGILSVTKASTAKSGKDLNGKTVAVDGLNTVAMLGVRNWIDATGGESSSVHFVELPFGAMPEALKTGRVDAASMNLTADPELGSANDALRLLAPVFDTLSPKFTFSAWFAMRDWVAKNPDLAKKFARVMREAAVWANAHHQESAAILAKYLKQTPAQIEGVTRVVYGTDFSPQMIQPSIDLAAKYGSIKKTFPASEFLNPTVR
jgi:NitT/TauT family transport system substrate-binding protein